jgi:hypothetical protein
MLKDFCTWLIGNAYPDYERLYRFSEGFTGILWDAVESYFRDKNESMPKTTRSVYISRIIDQLFALGAIEFRRSADPVRVEHEFCLRRSVIEASSDRQMDPTLGDFCGWLCRTHKVNERLWVPTKQAYSYFRSAVVEYFRELGVASHDPIVDQTITDYLARLKKHNAIKYCREAEADREPFVERPDYYLDRETIRAISEVLADETKP